MGTTLEDLGKLILRFSVGGILLFHGISKALGGIDFVQQQVNQAGLPAVLAYGVFAGEIAAPLLLIIGIFVRPAGLIVALDLLGAIVLARKNDIATVGPGGGWAIETEMLFLLGGLAIACLGAGQLALGKPSRWN
jgi:putative oxidoreductase